MRTDSSLFFSDNQRKEVAYAIFKLLSKATCPTVVLGNIGFALGSCFQYLAEYRRTTGADLDHELQILTTADQVLMSLFVDPTKPITGAQSVLIQANVPKE